MYQHRTRQCKTAHATCHVLHAFNSVSCKSTLPNRHEVFVMVFRSVVSELCTSYVSCMWSSSVNDIQIFSCWFVKKICMVILLCHMIGIIKISTLMTASVNYWPGFVAYTKIILLTYCNDKSKNTTKNHYYIRTQVEILFANVLIFLIYKKYGEFGMWSTMSFEEGL